MRWSACTRRCKNNKVLAEDLNENHNTITGTKLSSINKATVLEQDNTALIKRLYENKMKGDSTESSANSGDTCTWQDISEMVDSLSFVFTTSVTILGFATFLIVTKVASN